MFATDPKMARRWADHTPDFKKLPERVGGKDTEKKGFSLMDAIAAMGKEAADRDLVTKLAADTQTSPDLVRLLAKSTGLSIPAFVKAAYADPQDYVTFLQIASGAVKPGQIKQAGALGKLGGSIVNFMRKAKQGATGAKDPTHGGYANKGGVFGTSTPGTAVGRQMAKGPLGGVAQSKASRGAIGTAGVGAGVGAAAGVNSMVQPGQQPGPGAGPTEQAAAQGANASQAPQQSPAQTNGPAANPQQQGGGLSAGGKAAVAGAGVGLGALGAGAMMRKRKQKQQGTAKTAADGAKAVMRQAILTKIASDFRKQAADTFNTYLDTLTAFMTLEKTAQVRTLQAAVAKGEPLSHAIKVAYPLLNGEQRGILAVKLVKAAAEFGAKKKPAYKLQSRSTATCKPGEVGKTMTKMAGLLKQANPLLKALLSKAPGALPKGMKGVGEKIISRRTVRPPAKPAASPAQFQEEYAGMGPRMGTIPKPVMPTPTPTTPAAQAAQPTESIMAAQAGYGGPKVGTMPKTGRDKQARAGQSFMGRNKGLLQLLGMTGIGATAAGVAGRSMGGGKPPLQQGPGGKPQAGSATPLGKVTTALGR